MVMDSRTSQEVRGLKPHPRSCKQVFHRRRTSQEVRGLKRLNPLQCGGLGSRTSQEVRGLKRPLPYGTYMRHASHLARGAWIETVFKPSANSFTPSRTSQEVRGLKHRKEGEGV